MTTDITCTWDGDTLASFTLEPVGHVLKLNHEYPDTHPYHYALCTPDGQSHIRYLNRFEIDFIRAAREAGRREATRGEVQ